MSSSAASIKLPPNTEEHFTKEQAKIFAILQAIDDDDTIILVGRENGIEFAVELDFTSFDRLSPDTPNKRSGCRNITSKGSDLDHNTVLATLWRLAALDGDNLPLPTQPVTKGHKYRPLAEKPKPEEVEKQQRLLERSQLCQPDFLLRFYEFGKLKCRASKGGKDSDWESTDFTIVWNLDDDSLWLVHMDTVFDQPDRMNQLAGRRGEYRILKPSDRTGPSPVDSNRTIGMAKVVGMSAAFFKNPARTPNSFRLEQQTHEGFVIGGIRDTPSATRGPFAWVMRDR